MKLTLLLGLLLLLTACGTPLTSTPAPTPEAVHVTFPSALQPWADKLAGCASKNPGVGLYFNLSDSVNSDIQSEEIQLVLGNLDQNTPAEYLSQVGMEQVVVAVNKDNPLSKLTTDQLKSIFSGQTQVWEDDSSRIIHVWVMPKGEPTNLIFDSNVMRTESYTSEAMLAPDPAAMLQAISEDTEAIGFLPKSYVTTISSSEVSNIKIVQLEPDLEKLLDQPVVAITLGEPKGQLRSLLVCLMANNP